MQKLFFIIFISVAFSAKSQQRISEKIRSSASYIDLYTQGIDDLKIEPSASDFVEVILINADARQHFISLENTENLLKIEVKFDLPDGYNTTEKYCVIPPNYVDAILKIPENKTVTIFGNTIDIESKSYEGDFKIYIDKGDIKLNSNSGNTTINLFSGNIFASLSDSTIDIITNKGKILVDDKITAGSYKKYGQIDRKFVVKSIHANVVLTTPKTQ